MSSGCRRFKFMYLGRKHMDANFEEIKERPLAFVFGYP